MNRVEPESKAKRILKGAALVGAGALAGGAIGTGLGLGAGVYGVAHGVHTGTISAEDLKRPFAPKWKLKTAQKTFSMKNSDLKSRLVTLNSKVSKVVELSVSQDDENVGDKVKKVAGVAAAGAGLYTGASYLRGKLMQPADHRSMDLIKPGFAGVLSNIRSGHSANVADAKNAFGALKSAISPAMTSAQDVTKNAASAIGNQASSLAKTASTATTAGSDMVKKIFAGRYARRAAGAVL